MYRCLVVVLWLYGAGSAAAQDRASTPNTPEQAADAVLTATRDGGAPALKALAEKDAPDPWLVADELCARGEYDAAEAFAKAAPRPDTEKLADYVVAQRISPTDPALRKVLERANDAFRRNRPEEALSLTTAVTMLRSDVVSARLLHARGLALFSSRNLEASAKAFLASAEAAEQIGWLARAAATLHLAGMSCYHRSDYRAGLSAWEKALGCQERRANRRGAAVMLGNIGLAYDRLGDYPKALVQQERALAIMEETGDSANVARALGNIGNIHLYLGDAEKALSLQERALAMKQGLADRPGVAWTLGSIGNIQRSLGDYAKALDRQEQALAIMERLGDRKGAATMLASIGVVHWYAGDHVKALDSEERALGMMEELRDRAGVASVLGNIGIIHESLGDYTKALSSQGRALAIMEALRDRAGMATLLGNIGVIHQSLGDYSNALDCQNRALAMMEKLQDRAGIARTLGNIGTIHAALGDHTKALSAHGQSLERASELGLSETEVTALSNLADVNLSLDRPRTATTLARQAIERMSILVRGLADEEAATARERFSGLFTTGIGAGVAVRDPLEISFFLESGRAGALLEGLALRKRLGALVVPEDLRAAEVAARNRERVALWHYRHALEKGNGVADLWKEVEAAQTGVVEVIQRIQRQAKAQAALVYPKADSLNEIRSALRQGEALVLYALMTEESVALVVTPKKPRIVPLGKTEKIATAAEAFRRAVARPDERGVVVPPHESFDYLTKRLRKLIVEPLGLGEGVRRLLVSPDGPLCYLPFAVLCDAELAYVPSGTTYRLLREEEGRRGTKVLALGDPDYEAERDPNAMLVLARGAGLQPLPATREEAKAVGDVVLLGKDAAVPALREALAKQPRWRAVHLACHGLVNPERPVLSSLALTPAGEDDGFLKCLDVYPMKIPADLVVLSACETAQGKVYKAEGVMGWTRAFMFAGAPRVLVSLWKVDDAATRALMERFYEVWKDGKVPAATALRQAQAHVAKQEKWKHPYFWAAWQLWGLAE